MGAKRWFLIPIFAGLIISVIIIQLFFSRDSAEIAFQGKVFWDTLLPSALWGSLKLAVIVGILTAVLGISCAWIVTYRRMPLHKFVDRALFLPLTIPGYVYAFVYLSLFSYTGEISQFFREQLHINYHSAVGQTLTLRVSTVMSLALFPYVYVLAKMGFSTISNNLKSAAQMYAKSKWQLFREFYLPMIWPWIAAGVSLVIMEALADFGAVSTFNYSTFTTTIYKAWFGYFSFTMASRLSLLLLLFVFVLLATERILRHRRRFTTKNLATTFATQSKKATIWQVLWVYLVLAFSFVIPLGHLLYLAFSGGHLLEFLSWQHVGNSVIIALFGAFGLCLFALLLALAWRNLKGRGVWLFEYSQLGYAIPGTVLAVALVQILSGLGWSSGTSVVITLVAMVIAYAIRFLRVSAQPFMSSFERVSPYIEEAAVMLKEKPWGVFRRIQWPLLKPALFVAFALAFIEILKEMPLTLMTRPFGWDTLAVKIFEFTSEGEWAMAAIPSLGILVIGIIPSWWLSGLWKVQS